MLFELFEIITIAAQEEAIKPKSIAQNKQGKRLYKLLKQDYLSNM